MPTKAKSKKSTPKKVAPIAPEKLKAIVQRLESGESRLIAESKKLGFHDNTPLRNALRELLGGKPAYERMISKAIAARQKPAAKNGKPATAA